MWKRVLNWKKCRRIVTPGGGNWQREMKKESLSGKSGGLAGIRTGRITNPPSTAAHEHKYNVWHIFFEHDNETELHQRMCVNFCIHSAINRNINTCLIHVVLTVETPPSPRVFWCSFTPTWELDWHNTGEQVMTECSSQTEFTHYSSMKSYPGQPFYFKE